MSSKMTPECLLEDTTRFIQILVHNIKVCQDMFDLAYNNNGINLWLYIWQIPVFPVLYWRRCFLCGSTTNHPLHEGHKMSPFVGVPFEWGMQRFGFLHGLFPVIRQDWFRVRKVLDLSSDRLRPFETRNPLVSGTVCPWLTTRPCCHPSIAGRLDHMDDHGQLNRAC